MYCIFCGASISDSANYCPKCGKKQKPDPEPVMLRCPDCGTENEPGSNFCENCGKKLNEEPALLPDGTSIPEGLLAASVPPLSPSGTEQTYIPPSSQPAGVETSSQTGPKPKKKSGCCSVVLIILILLVLLGLAAGYYFLKVYDGAQVNPVGELISGIKPTAESVLTKIPEAITGMESVLTKIPEAISRIELKPIGTPVPMFIRPTEGNVPAVQSTVESGLVILPTATPGGSLWRTEPFGTTVQPTAVISLENIRDVNGYSTTEMGSPSDFLWVTQDIAHGTLPAGIDWLTGFDQLLGGWKAYIIDDLYGQYGSGTERLCRVNFTGNTNGNGMTFNWGYVYDPKTGEGYNDNTPPAAFYGDMQNGRFYGSGAGSIDMAAFYVLDGHEYAVGVLHWPDGILGSVFLVRP